MRQVLRLKAVTEATGLSAPTIYRAIRRGEFPKQHQLSPGCVGWFDVDLQAWMESRGISTRQPIVRRTSDQGTAKG